MGAIVIRSVVSRGAENPTRDANTRATVRVMQVGTSLGWTDFTAELILNWFNPLQGFFRFVCARSLAPFKTIP